VVLEDSGSRHCTKEQGASLASTLRLVRVVATIHNGLMRKLPHRLGFASAVALALLAGAGLGGCGEAPANVDPQAVLSEASVNMKQLAGFHFVYELHQPESADKAEGVQTVEGDVNAAGDVEATVELLLGGVLVNADFVALGNIHYIKYPILGWVQKAPKDSPLGQINLAAFSIQVLDRIASASYEGTDKKGGKKTYHISGMVAAADLEQIAGKVSTAELFAADLWVGIEDSLLYEVDTAGPMTAEEADGTWRGIVLSNLGVAVEIKAPQ
jgi:hypothetical protein